MEKMRQPFQGVRNIVRFNWHYYVLSIGVLIVLYFLSLYFFPASLPFVMVILALSALTIFISLAVSAYVYDYSELYSLSWLDGVAVENNTTLANIHSGFDETSVLLQKKYPGADLIVFDFYDPAKHTEVSIRRARKAYPAFPGTITINTDSIPLKDDSCDLIFLILAAHEIRNESERNIFFAEVKRILKYGGRVIVTEHLRDISNFLAYNIGAFHFHSRKTWLAAFRTAELDIEKEFKVTPFITTFILSNNGTSS